MQGDLISRSEYKKRLEDYSKHLAVRYDKANKEGDFVEMERVNNECAAYRMLKLMLDDMPTTTEAEIRAKAIGEFAKALKERCKRNFMAFDYQSVSVSEINRIAEELKKKSNETQTEMKGE